MWRDLILGTAGHIDHGKTSLVKALTGIDCDRLPEEKRRGITIDIGFATLELGEFQLGIVDVPGHERFIKNMLAGATGIDLAMLVVAADDSVMPQTREHLEILRLLGLRHGLIVLTKCDLADPESQEVVELEVRDLVRGSSLENARLVRTSAQSGGGIGDLKAALLATCREIPPASGGRQSPGDGSPDWFRMAIDRSFIVQGHGTVVTGSVTSGCLTVGDEVEWLPRGERVRVRSLQNHGRPVPVVQRGMRAAINLAGVHHENVARGQELALPGYLRPTRTLTVRLHCLATAGRPLKHRASVRFHSGTAEVMGTLALLDAERIEPGNWGLAQVFLREAVTTVWGQPFVVRSPSAAQTLGGGQVLQPVTRKLRRQQPEVLERLGLLWAGDAEQRARGVAWFAGLTGVTAPDLVRGAGLAPQEATELGERLRAGGKLVAIGHHPGLIHAEVLGDLQERILKTLTRLHTAFPLQAGHERHKLRAELAYIGNDEVVDRAIDGLRDQGRVVVDGSAVRRSDFKPRLSANLHKLKDKVIAAYASAGLRPPRAASFADLAGGNAGNLDALMNLCVSEGHLVHLDEDFYLHRPIAERVTRLLADKMAAGLGLTIADVRDLLGTGRKQALLVCTYLDRIGITRRDGDLRVLAK
jgi:selenocysteine-specific elongation factor